MDKDLHINENDLLVLQVSEGNRAAFDILYKKYWKHVYNAAYKRLENSERAKDVVQDVFTQLWMQIGVKKSTTTIQNLPAFLYTAVRNNVFKLWEKEKRSIPVAELLAELERGRKESCDTELLYRELQKAFEAALEKLPEQQQKIFRMHYMDDRSSAEIADLLDISPKTVRNQLGRALKKLRPTFFILAAIVLP